MHEHTHPTSSFWHSRRGIALLILGVAAGFFLLFEHRAHALEALPYLLILACPLMHLFMHHGHDHGHAGRQPPEIRGKSSQEKVDAR